MLDEEVEVAVASEDEGVVAIAGRGGDQVVDALFVVGDVAWVEAGPVCIPAVA